MAPGTYHIDLSVEKYRRKGGEKNDPKAKWRERPPENAVLSSWSWCKQGWPRLRHPNDRWPTTRACAPSRELRKKFISLRLTIYPLNFLYLQKANNFNTMTALVNKDKNAWLKTHLPGSTAPSSPRHSATRTLASESFLWQLDINYGKQQIFKDSETRTTTNTRFPPY